MPRVVEHPAARRELVGIADLISEDRPAVARKFLAAARKAFELLGAMPEAGGRWESANPRFRELRCFPIPRYENYVILYIPHADRVEILHVLHGARDLAAYFDQEE